jgi:hypothetical protein
MEEVVVVVVESGREKESYTIPCEVLASKAGAGGAEGGTYIEAS